MYPLSAVWSVLSWTEALGSQCLSYPNFPTLCFFYRIVTPVLIHWWLWNNAQILIQPRRGTLLFFEVFIKFLGHMGWKISDLSKVWIKLLGWSQLSNPSDLPCLFSCKMIKQNQLENHLVFSCHFCEAPFLLVKHRVTWITWNWHSYCCWFHCEDTESKK